jgi:hypothetical protein
MQGLPERVLAPQRRLDRKNFKTDCDISATTKRRNFASINCFKLDRRGNMAIRYCSALFGVASVLCFGMANALAQEGVTYQSFTGILFILDNPTSAACQAKNINFADVYTVVYRIAIDPTKVSDALAVHGTRGESQMYSTQSPSFSLQGPSTTAYNYINKYGSYGTLSPSSSNLTLRAGLTGLPAAPGNANVIINGSINDFNANSGCDIASVHAALARNPD